MAGDPRWAQDVVQEFTKTEGYSYPGRLHKENGEHGLRRAVVMHAQNVSPAGMRPIEVCLALLLLAGCQAERKSVTPLPQPQWAPATRLQVEEVIRHVQTALQQNERRNPSGVAASLGEAERKLQRLVAYNLPLQEAAEECSNAYHAYSLGNNEEADRQLEEVENRILEIAKGQSERVTTELEKPLELVGKTRLDIDTMPATTVQNFEDLLRLLNEMSIKYSLVL